MSGRLCSSSRAARRPRRSSTRSPAAARSAAARLAKGRAPSFLNVWYAPVSRSTPELALAGREQRGARARLRQRALEGRLDLRQTLERLPELLGG